jgi:hypothetical protein
MIPCFQTILEGWSGEPLLIERAKNCLKVQRLRTTAVPINDTFKTGIKRDYWRVSEHLPGFAYIGNRVSDIPLASRFVFRFNMTAENPVQLLNQLIQTRPRAASDIKCSRCNGAGY